MEYIVISVISFVLYVSFIVYKYGILPSISDSWYKLPGSQKWLFPAFLWTFSFPIMIIYQKPLLFLAGAFICLVGVNPKFKEKIDSLMHSLSAYTGIGLGMLSLLIDFKLYFSVAVFVGIASYIKWNKTVENKIWGQEIAAIVIILLSLILFK